MQKIDLNILAIFCFTFIFVYLVN